MNPDIVRDYCNNICDRFILKTNVSHELSLIINMLLLNQKLPLSKDTKKLFLKCKLMEGVSSISDVSQALVDTGAYTFQLTRCQCVCVLLHH